MKNLLLMGFLLAVAGTIGAQEEIFEDGGALEAPPPPVADAQQGRFLEGAAELGGRFWATMEPNWEASPGDEPEGRFLSDVGADLSLDARPEADYRIYAKIRLPSPFETASVRELFADLEVTPGTSIRVGKQSLRSGVGYYFSPADFLSQASIDPSDPDQEREGPTAVRTRWAAGTTSVTAVVVTEDVTQPDDLGVYGQVEGVWEAWEWGTGVYARKDSAPRGMATLTGSLGAFQTFSEITASLGSDRTFLEASSGPTGFETREDQKSWFVSWTSGVRWNDDEHRLSVTAQLYQNGEGYEDDQLLEEARFLVRKGTLTASDLAAWGRFQGAVSASARDLGGTDFDLSLLWLSSNLNQSGRVVPKLTYSALEHLEMAVSFPWSYGREGSQYAPGGQKWGWGIELKLGAGSF